MNIFSKLTERIMKSLLTATGRILIGCIVLLWGYYIMLHPIIEYINFDFTNLFFSFVILSNYLSNIMFFIIANKTKSTEYIIIPGLAIIISEYYFFHGFSIWIDSSSTAAIGLIFTAILLLLIFGGACLIAFTSIKIRR